MDQLIYGQFLNGIADSGKSRLVLIYDAVRNLPYGAIGQRNPMDVALRRRGSCSGKHLLLRELLRRSGYEAEIITMFTHFESRISPHPAFGDELNGLLREGEIPDFHHYVRARERAESAWVSLDATWHDALQPYGLPVNSAWNGTGDTVLASTPIYELPTVEDLLTEKARLVGTLSKDQQDRRSRFFQLISDWILNH